MMRTDAAIPAAIVILPGLKSRILPGREASIEITFDRPAASVSSWGEAFSDAASCPFA